MEPIPGGIHRQVRLLLFQFQCWLPFGWISQNRTSILTLRQGKKHEERPPQTTNMCSCTVQKLCSISNSCSMLIFLRGDTCVLLHSPRSQQKLAIPFHYSYYETETNISTLVSQEHCLTGSIKNFYGMYILQIFWVNKGKSYYSSQKGNRHLCLDFLLLLSSHAKLVKWLIQTEWICAETEAPPPIT